MYCCRSFCSVNQKFSRITAIVCGSNNQPKKRHRISQEVTRLHLFLADMPSERLLCALGVRLDFLPKIYKSIRSILISVRLWWIDPGSTSLLFAIHLATRHNALKQTTRILELFYRCCQAETCRDDPLIILPTENSYRPSTANWFFSWFINQTRIENLKLCHKDVWRKYNADSTSLTTRKHASTH